MRCRHIRRPVKLDYARHRARPWGGAILGTMAPYWALWRHTGHEAVGYGHGAERAWAWRAGGGGLGRGGRAALSYLDVARIAAEVDFGE